MLPLNKHQYIYVKQILISLMITDLELQEVDARGQDTLIKQSPKSEFKTNKNNVDSNQGYTLYLNSEPILLVSLL